MFACTTAAHFVSRAYQLLVLFVIFNNQCWNALKRATKGVYPNGCPTKTDTWLLTDLMPSPSFERMADVHGAYGELVEDPSQVLPALRRGLTAVCDEKWLAILNIVCKHPWRGMPVPTIVNHRKRGPHGVVAARRIPVRGVYGLYFFKVSTGQCAGRKG